MRDKKGTNKWVDTLAKDLKSVNPLDELLEESLDLLDEMLEKIEHLYIGQKLLGAAVVIQSATIFLIYMLLTY